MLQWFISSFSVEFAIAISQKKLLATLIANHALYFAIAYISHEGQIVLLTISDCQQLDQILFYKIVHLDSCAVQAIVRHERQWPGLPGCLYTSSDTLALGCLL